MKVDRRDFVTGIILLVFSVYVVIESRKFPLMGPWATSPGIFPTLVGGCLAFLSILLIILSMRQKEARNVFTLDKEVVRRFVVIGSMAVAYLLLLSLLHFVWASAVFMFALMYYLGGGRPLTLGLISIVVAFAVNYMFTTFFKLVLP